MIGCYTCRYKIDLVYKIDFIYTIDLVERNDLLYKIALIYKKHNNIIFFYESEKNHPSELKRNKKKENEGFL